MSSTPGLWPDPIAMQGYLERWTDYVRSIEKRLEKEVSDRAIDATRAAHEIDGLKVQIATQMAPVEKQILDYQRQVRDLQAQVRDLEAERSTAINRLAHLVEVSPTSKGITMLTLINDLIMLIEETKQQFRASL